VCFADEFWAEGFGASSLQDFIFGAGKDPDALVGTGFELWTPTIQSGTSQAQPTD